MTRRVIAAGGGTRRPHPDRARRAQLPDQRAQQLAEGLREQRLLAQPTVRADGPAVLQPAQLRQQVRQRDGAPEPAQRDAASGGQRAEQGTRPRRARRDEAGAVELRLCDADAPGRDRGRRLEDPAGARDDDEQGRGQRDRRRHGPVLRLRRALQGLHDAAHLGRAQVGGHRGRGRKRDLDRLPPVPPEHLVARPGPGGEQTSAPQAVLRPRPGPSHRVCTATRSTRSASAGRRSRRDRRTRSPPTRRRP